MTLDFSPLIKWKLDLAGVDPLFIFLQDKMFYIRMMLALLVFITILVFFALFLGFSQATEIEDVDFKSIKTQNVTGTKFSSNQRSRSVRLN